MVDVSLIFPSHDDSNRGYSDTYLDMVSKATANMSLDSTHIEAIASEFWEIFCKECQEIEKIHGSEDPNDPQVREQLRLEFAGMIRASTDSESVVQSLIEYFSSDLLPDSVDQNQLKFSTMHKMIECGLLYEVQSALAAVLPQQIRHFIYQDTTVNRQKLTQWLQEMLFPQLEELMVLDNETKGKLTECADEELAELRIEGLFNTIYTENPEIPSEYGDLVDLKATMNTPEIRTKCIQKLTSDINSRLLNAGVETVDIIITYLACMRVFSYLDPRGVLMQAVSDIIHPYLKERPDTVDELAAGLFGVPSSPLMFLSERLNPSSIPRSTSSNAFALTFDQSFDKIEWKKKYIEWLPDPVDAPADFVKQKTEDVVTSLLALYDNKEVFIKRLAVLFSDKLLELGADDSVEDMVQICNHLSARFGDANMQYIKVMISDIVRSREDANDIHEADASLASICGLVLSKLFWPHIKASSSEGLLLPRDIKQKMDKYTQQYSALPGHNTRGIKWLHNKGRVSITVQLKDRQLDLMVLPEQATLIMAFEKCEADQDLALDELIILTGLKKSELLEGIQFWASHGVIAASGERYRILETADAPSNSADVPIAISNQAMGTQSSRKESIEEMQVYWSYIVGMLTNLGALPVEKIHSFLVMFVPRDDPYVKTKTELESFLLAMVEEEKLVLIEEVKFGLAP